MTISPTTVLQDSAQFLRRGQSKALRQWQRLPLMDRWLFGELLGPLLFGVAAFTAVTLSVGFSSNWFVRLLRLACHSPLQSKSFASIAGFSCCHSRWQH